MIWIEPYWGWTGSSWQWIDGHWEAPPQRGAIWVVPQWDGSNWTPGYWTMAGVYAQEPQYSGSAYQVGQYTSGYFTPSDLRDATGLYQDYAVWLNAGDLVTFVVSGGPMDGYPGQRLAVGLTLLLDARPIAGETASSTWDAQLTHRARRAGVYTLRVSSRSGPAATGSYILTSAQGQWTSGSLYDRYWATPAPAPVAPAPAAPGVPDCRTTLLQLGHSATNLMFCDGAEPYCADALLRAGHAPANLQFCQGVQPQCAVQLLASGQSPTLLMNCR